MKRILNTFLFVFIFLLNHIGAQPEATSLMRSDGKLYVVVGVILMIFVGLIIFLVYLERKLTSLENQINTNE